MNNRRRIDHFALSAQKTPVSWLHEICTRNNITPKYDLLQVEGAVHEPIFQYRLTLEHNGKTYEETGSGRSKKEAKHNTARAMLASMKVAKDILFEPRDRCSHSYEQEERRRNCSGASGDDTAAGANPVGILQELCMKMKYPPPTYGVDSEEGLPHERLFAMACRVGDQFIQIGKGKSKKLAKRQAAHLMSEFLRALPLESACSMVYDDDDDKIIDQISFTRSDEEGSMQGKLSKTVENTLSAQRQYLNMTGPVLDKLKDPEFIPDDPVEFVVELGKEQHFEPMYVDFEENSQERLCQSIVQLTLDPPAVLMGEGKDHSEARVEAANDVISYFRIMTGNYLK